MRAFVRAFATVVRAFAVAVAKARTERTALRVQVRSIVRFAARAHYWLLVTGGGQYLEILRVTTGKQTKNTLAAQDSTPFPTTKQ